MPIIQASEMIRLKKISPVELVKQCISVINRLNPQLRAFITVLEEQSMIDAYDAENEIMADRWRGRLHGIPVGIKDFYDTAGVATTAGFVHFANRIPAKDAHAVAKVKEAGGIVIGKTNMHELGMGTTSTNSHYGSVRNPWNPNYVAGGSSGGSGVAVATGMCYVTIDTDAVGSCRIPAACCGVTGFKATYGWLSMAGILEGEPVDDFILHVAHSAVMCRSAEDAGIIFNELADRGHVGEEGKRVRLGVVRNYVASDEINSVFHQAVSTLQSLGYLITEIDAPVEPAVDLSRLEEARNTVTNELFHDVDVLLLPTTTDLTPTMEQATSEGPTSISPGNTFFANYYGLPAISVPCGFGSNGLPLGMQIVGPMHGESAVIAVARSYQEATDWHRKFSGS